MKLDWRFSLILTALAFSACGKGSSDAKKTFYVPLAKLNSGGCLNVGSLLSSMKNFPPETKGRVYSTQIGVTGSSDTRDTFVKLLTKSTYRFDEDTFSNIKPYDPVFHFDSARQAGCTSASLINANGTHEDYDIANSSASSIQLQRSRGTSDETLEITWVSPQKLRVHHVYNAEDPCNNESEASVDTTQVYEWGADDVAAVKSEVVSRGLLQQVSATLVDVPDEIAKILAPNAVNASVSADDQVTVSTKALTQLRDGAIKDDFLVCDPPPAPEAPAPAPPAASPSPTPTSSH